MPFHQTYAGIKQPAIGYLIRKIRKTLKLTQEKFAAQLRITVTKINRWKNGYTRSSLLALQQFDTSLQRSNNPPDLTLQEPIKTIQEKYFSQRKEEE